MPKQQFYTEKAGRVGGAYSQALKVGDFIFVSGAGATDATTNKITGDTIEEQTTRTLENIKVILETAGATLGDVVKATVHLSDMSLFPRYNVVYASYFADPKPARTTVGSQLGPNMLVEIDVIAYVGDK